MQYSLGRATTGIIAVLFLVSACGTTEKSTVVQTSSLQRTIGCNGILHKGAAPDTVKGEPCREVLSRKETAERLDRENLLYTGRLVTDRDTSMLDVPETVKKYRGTEFTMAGTAPEIDFVIIPVEPRFVRVYNNQYESGWWGNYCQSNYFEPTGKFYTGVADHGVYDAHIYLVEYDPVTKKVRCLPEVNRSIGRSPDRFGDGILHGWLDFYQSEQLARPHLWFCTYWGRFPEPRDEDYATGYDGGHIVSYDMATEEFVDYGVPLPRTSWPYHRVDSRRGMLYAVSLFSEFLAWDINAQKTRWAGYLPKGMTWYNRSILLDAETGMVYTTNADESDTLRHMIRYNPVRNRFTVMDCHMPKNARTGAIDHMRAQTRDRGPDNLVWGVTSSGELFSFDSDNEKIEDKGINWPGDGRYTCTMERSPGGRYIYYQVMSYKDGSPVIQYDTKTGKKKVLTFLYPYYSKKYGYIPTGSYSFKLDSTGGLLFMVWNGAFIEPAEDIGVDFWGHCSIMLMHIPESERIE